MKSIVKVFIICILLSQSIFAIDTKYYQNKFKATKKLYLASILSNNKKNEILYLKQLVKYGKKLNVDTLQYRKELKRLDKTYVFQNHTKSNIKNSIISVKQSNNSIVINFNHKINRSYINFSEKKIARTYTDIFNIKGYFKDAYPTKISIKGVDKIKIFQKNSKILSLILEHKTNLKTIYLINNNQIIIKILNLSTKNKKVIMKKNSTKKRKKKKKNNTNQIKMIKKDILYPSKKTIVIDPGHGGKDSGARYKRKRLEKDIVLKISKYLKDELQRKGFKVFLTRTRDKYIKLPNRTKYANKKHADIFISVHANAARKNRANKAHGVESYFLSPARSARAKRIAALENKGDMSGMGWSSKNSLLTILNRAKITAANKMAIDIQKNMLYTLRKQYGKKNIRDGGVREGPFWVLVGAQMPSVLIEVGYISHPKEGYRISTKRYQKLIAKGIANGIESYFLKN
ncbi:MAG: N-acetylmuramoyl-L-alanine amidase [Arcobacter sp.]|nr:MAG: N-acetylmuramoyl-L-alanine amidase [Arcobacter sp.]